MAESEVHLRESESSSLPRCKPAPKESQIPTKFNYCPSDDGTDENLLILLHGLGDTHIPFSKLGRSLKLPQTAILALRAPEKIPFLHEEAYQWYTSFDQLGDLIDRPNPTPALDLLSKLFAHLTDHCGWSSDKIHLFGFAQGGSVALEFAIKHFRQNSNANGTSGRLGSVVSISGPLLSYPTLSSPCPTPVLAVYRPPPAEPHFTSGDLTALKKAFGSIREGKMPPRGAGMPSSREEWEPIMRFWSERLSRRQVDGLYEVMSGITPLTSYEVLICIRLQIYRSGTKEKGLEAVFTCAIMGLKAGREMETAWIINGGGLSLSPAEKVMHKRPFSRTKRVSDLDNKANTKRSARAFRSKIAGLGGIFLFMDPSGVFKAFRSSKLHPDIMYFQLSLQILVLGVAALAVADSQVDFSAYPYKAPGSNDSRSPCPGLNILANHGFLPRDGRNITVPMIVDASLKAFNLQPDLMTMAAKQGLLSSPHASTLSLEDLKLHNTVVEMDASLSREDFHLGDNLHFNETIFTTLADSNPGHDFYNTTSAGQVQHARLADSLQRNPNVTNALWRAVARTGASAFYLSVMGNPITGVAPKRFVQIFFREERLPIAEGWKRSSIPINSTTFAPIVGQIFAASNWQPTGDGSRDEIVFAM
ncbi:hypothetical protein V5O48_008048 [Marasmius crinis-equi]|uniref:Heme haloperoxidase family profile domain-containing protein n=1 Tax=Marasmius crinis-equi TaxID=585013 RepID=A0ABR3FFQ8_9AGAR